MRKKNEAPAKHRSRFMESPITNGEAGPHGRVGAGTKKKTQREKKRIRSSAEEVKSKGHALHRPITNERLLSRSEGL